MALNGGLKDLQRITEKDGLLLWVEELILKLSKLPNKLKLKMSLEILDHDKSFRERTEDS